MRAIENSEQLLTQSNFELTLTLLGIQESYQIFTMKTKACGYVLTVWDQTVNIPHFNCLMFRNRLISLLRQNKKILYRIWTDVILIDCLCFRGKQTLCLTVKDGAPLPFAYDILTTALHYGNRVFVEYSENMPDYFKQSFPKGYTWERSLAFENGGICIARSDIE